MIINLCQKKILKVLILPILLYLTIFNREIKAEKKLVAATEQDLFLYKGMGASYLCIASKAGIEFPKALGAVSYTHLTLPTKRIV